LSRPLSGEEIGTLVQCACLLEASAPKPGNVSRSKDFDDTRFEDFLLSAAAIGPAFSRAGEADVGETVLAAVRATRRFVRVNTNLGIILLVAPLARARSEGSGPLREEVKSVLARLTLADARAVYEAIRLANPGGLGKAEAQDVSDEPTLSLLETMALAAGRDAIAREYVTAYDVTFGLAVPALQRARRAGFGWPVDALEAYLCVLAEVPDTLIARKNGLSTAQEVSDRAREVLRAGELGSPERARAAETLDSELHGAGNRQNPGTTADLVAAALFVALSEEL
jgi:triphosphoribosyl-dephospho-CoA synthase